jgi:hypothetical protein
MAIGRLDKTIGFLFRGQAGVAVNLKGLPDPVSLSHKIGGAALTINTAPGPNHTVRKLGEDKVWCFQETNSDSGTFAYLGMWQVFPDTN